MKLVPVGSGYLNAQLPKPLDTLHAYTFSLPCGTMMRNGVSVLAVALVALGLAHLAQVRKPGLGRHTRQWSHGDPPWSHGDPPCIYRPEAGSRFRFQGKLCPVPRFQRCQKCQFLVPALGHPLANMSHAGSSKFLNKCMITL